MSLQVKAAIHYMTFAKIFAMICNLEESTLVVEIYSQSADFVQSELTDFTENCIVYNEHTFFWLQTMIPSS